MATLTARFGFLSLLGMALLGCTKPVGLGAPVTPLVNLRIQVNGNLTTLAFPRIALVWGKQWQPEPFCTLPPESLALPSGSSSTAIQAVQAAGCPDNFRFVPARDGADVPLSPDGSATIPLVDLPGSDVLVGDLTSRVAYASLIVYADRNQNGVFDLAHPPRHRRRGQPPPPPDDGGVAASPDIVYAASFISMTRPDQRVAFLEGTFNTSVAFYPREGCDPPLAGFSLLLAGGFEPNPDPLEVARNGQIPFEIPGSCVTAGLDQTVVLTPPPASSTDVQALLPGLACTANDGGGTSFYLAAPADPPAGYPLDPASATLPWACASFPHLSGDVGGVVPGQQFVIPGPPGLCPYLNHYTLRGCSDDPACANGWDNTATPPAWWQNYCPAQP